MKRCIFPILLCAALLGVNKSQAQAQKQNQQHNAKTVAGHFEMNSPSGPATNVNYVLYPAPFTTHLNTAVNTAQPTLFNVDVLDANNNVLISWTPAQISHNYNHDFDISALTPGSYHVNIRKDNSDAVLKTIPFTK